MFSFISPDTLAQKSFIGLMSGTSMDGVDGVLAYFDENNVCVLASVHLAMPETLRSECLALNQMGSNELHRAALAGIALSKLYAETVRELLLKAQCPATEVAAIGCHGQTVRHQPNEGYTLQLVNGALLTELTSITAIVDFRSRDIAAGGQGAPLVPGFHQFLFGVQDRTRAVVNIGGFSNLSALRPGHDPIGFDCGPGNALMDAWIQLHQGKSFDRNGEWAQTGSINEDLLRRLLEHPFFKLAPPRSTGRDFFHLDWLQKNLVHTHTEAIPAENIQRTLLELSARAIADAMNSFAPDLDEVFLCGGGALNGTLVHRLQALLAPRPVRLTGEIGIQEDQVEALAFAWLARRTLRGEAGNVGSVTGAKGPRILGAIYLA
jgi:anhydro-N-acetylmuramic acid kinase